jgi:hypothetical protein
VSTKTPLLAALAFIIPVGAILFQNQEALRERFKADPSVGKVIYFSAPG